VLPADNTDLENTYLAQDYLDVDTKNDVRVAQTATNEYAIHQFKDYVGSAASWGLEWEGQTDLAPSSSKVVLQIYNHNGGVWVDVDEETTASADQDFTLSGTITVNPDYYKDGSGLITARVYQEAI